MVQEPVSAGDPLAGLERPHGEGTALQDLADAYGAAAGALTSAAQQILRMVGHVLGQTWSGTAAAACGAACVRSAQAVFLAARAYESASAALTSHAARLSMAQAEFDVARPLADEAMAEERAHHAAAAKELAPGPSFGDLLWQSPLRGAARMRAEEAVADAAASARRAAGALHELTAPLTPAQGREAGHWYDQVTGFATGVWDGVAGPVALGAGLVGLNGDAGQNWSVLGAGLSHAVTNPEDFAKALVGWDDLSQGNYGHWAGELAPTAVAAFFSGGAAAGLKGADAAATATRAGEAVSAATTVAKGLPGALKDVRVLVAETPDGLRLPVGLDTNTLRTLLSQARDGQTAAGVSGVVSSVTPSEAAALVKAAHPVGSAMKADALHRSAAFLVDEIAANGSVFRTVGRDGVERLLVQVPGEVDGVPGRFEWILDGERLTHQMFVRHGTINGVPIKP